MRMRTFLQQLPAMSASLLLLSACMSVPISSYSKLARLSPLDADPQVIRVAVLVPEELMMKTGDAVLEVYINPIGGDRQSGKYPLDVLGGNTAAQQLPGKMKPGQKIYVLKLTADDAVALQTLQDELRKAKAAGMRGEGGFSVGFVHACWNGSFPRDGRPMPFDPWIRTEAGGEFFPLFSGVDVKDLLKIAKLDALPDCGLQKQARGF